MREGGRSKRSARTDVRERLVAVNEARTRSFPSQQVRGARIFCLLESRKPKSVLNPMGTTVHSVVCDG